MPSPDERDHWIKRDVEADTLNRGFLARLEAASIKGERLVGDYRSKVAETLLQAGITLIPSDHLLDHQFVVSRGVYEAAKKL